MRFSRILAYYSRKEIREKIAEEAKNREVCWRYYDGTFSKRPSQILHEKDVLEIVKRKATSFHVSVERWKAPLLLRKEMKDRELDELRIGWDLLIDIDSSSLTLSKIYAKFVIDALKDHDITRFGVKFSGSTGFHIIVPFESFPPHIEGEAVVNLFPDLGRDICEYLYVYCKEPFEKYLLDKYFLDELAELVGKSEEKIFDGEKLKIEELVKIDSGAMSKRHLFRSSYSFNEKKWLISIPIKDPIKFRVEDAVPENVTVDLSFIPEGKRNDAKFLFKVASEWSFIKKFEMKIETEKKIGKIRTKKKIPEEFFPPCIKRILQGLEDGRKRALFILVNFLWRVGWKFPSIEKLVWEWNEKNDPPLRESYLKSQLKWHKKLKEPYMPPNCDNKSYYLDMNICQKDRLCEGIKNPLTYTLRRYREWLRRSIQEKSRRS